ncbi:MAG: MFS transporter, partial [Planctomycetota bacterium]
MEGGHPFVRTRLSAMMFLEFLLWAAWYVPISGYMNNILGFSGTQIGWIMSTTALGAMIAPLFVGYVVDRFFATERALGVLHLIGALCLILASFTENFPLLLVLLVINGMCFMPTLALANSLAFRNIDDPNKFSRIAVFGTIGWIVASWLAQFVFGAAEDPFFFYLAGGGALVMGLYCFTLPHTPPKSAEETGGDVLGLKALKLLKEPSFLLFTVSIFLICIPLSWYFQWITPFLSETGRPWPVALPALGQCCEMVVMFVMPYFIFRVGLKWVLLIGMTAWFLRYLLFASGSFPLVILGLLLHGFCYCFVFVAAFIYADKTVPRHMSASAQSFIAFLTWGLGMFIGFRLAGMVGDAYPPQTVAAVVEDAKGAKKDVPDAELPNWSSADKEDWQGPKETIDLAEMFDSEGEQAARLNVGEPMMVIGKVEMQGLPDEGVVVERKTAKGKLIEKRTYARADLIKAL